MRYVSRGLLAFVTLLSFSQFAFAQWENERISIRSGDKVIRHQNFQARLSDAPRGQQGDDTLLRKDATFIVRPGLAGEGISFESVNFPGYFLRHNDFVIRLHQYDRTKLFREDATFRVEGDGGSVSFRSVNYPDRYITVRDGDLGLDSRRSWFRVIRPLWEEGASE